MQANLLQPMTDTEALQLRYDAIDELLTDSDLLVSLWAFIAACYKNLLICLPVSTFLPHMNQPVLYDIQKV